MAFLLPETKLSYLRWIRYCKNEWRLHWCMQCIQIKRWAITPHSNIRELCGMPWVRVTSRLLYRVQCWIALILRWNHVGSSILVLNGKELLFLHYKQALDKLALTVWAWLWYPQSIKPGCLTTQYSSQTTRDAGFGDYLGYFEFVNGSQSLTHNCECLHHAPSECSHRGQWRWFRACCM